MEQQTEEMVQAKPIEEDDIKIDVGRILRALLHYFWLIVVIGIVVAGLAFGFTKLFIPPTYESTATIYVRNSANSSTINSSDLNVANAYKSVIMGRDTLEQVIAESDTIKQLGYTYESLVGCVEVEVHEVGFMKLIVTCADPEEAQYICSEITRVLPERVEEVFDRQQSFISIADKASLPKSASGPNTIMNTLIGGAAGVALSCLVIVIIELLNNKIYNDEYLISTYGLPVLANIPDFDGKKRKKSKSTDYYHYSYET